MAVFDSVDFNHHENVLYAFDEPTGLKAIIAIHDTTLGPALGGCRMYPYENPAQALKDVLRLSRGMTYKSALARLPLGGGKAVIIGDPKHDKSPTLFHAMGRFINRLHGNYIAAQDSGISVEDLKIIAEATPHVAGAESHVDDHHRLRSGDPSPATAWGVFIGMQAALRYRLGGENFEGVRVAIQGVGNVGFALAKHLYAAGAKLWVADIHPDNVHRAVKQCQATAVPVDAIAEADVDIFSPCALGCAINAHNIDTIRAPIIAGSANNQLETDSLGDTLRKRSILYAPDFVISAGGITHVHFMRSGRSWQEATEHVAGIAHTLAEIFSRADAEGVTTAQLALTLAEERLAAAREGQAVALPRAI